MLSSALEDTLRLFGKERFRPMQRELMECALAGRSCIGILPTGSGKSLCYQIPAVLGDGVTVVVSPLIALMRDQVAGLEKLGVAAARYDSSLAEEEKGALLDSLKSGASAFCLPLRSLWNPRGFSRSWSLFPRLVRGG
ncbi:MAG: DEAD/DEAH box helicase [Akkermansia sp.]